MADRISIKADREYLREIFQKIERGEYAVPVFQRDFVWKPSQMINLFDSILRGYPIGSLVLWNSSDVHQSKHILTDQIINVPTPDYYILDGRQRLTTLYGVLSPNEEKSPVFKLFFNLEKQTFEFSQKEVPWLVPVSVVYDTFSLLDWMSNLPNEVRNEEKLRSYILNAKNLNSLLQEYIVSEILISQCDLSEAGVVFSRINSTGTRIESLDMLQAVKYKGDNSALISSYVQQIQRRLEALDFQGLNAKDILNCCFWYTDRKYYDSRIESLDKENLEEIFPKVEGALVRAIIFLRDHCGVLSLKLLPYTKQLLALVWVFKDNAETDAWRLFELKRWFFYTTYTQMFMNGALQHIRNIHNRLEAFILHKSDTAWDYEELSRPSFGFRFSGKSAQARFMALAIVNRLISSGVAPSEMGFSGFDHPYNSSSPLSYVPRITVNGARKYIEDEVADWATQPFACQEYALEKRQQFMMDLEMRLLESLGFVFEDLESA